MTTAHPRLKDREVRFAIHQQIVPTLTCGSSSRVLDEFQICLGEARIDVAVVNGHLHGIEIKSEADTLDRLNRQVETYGRVFDTLTIVCGRNHLDAVQTIVPKWWGIYVAKSCADTGVILECVRANVENPSVEAIALAQFLWKDEIVALLRAAGRTKGVASKSRRLLWPDLVSAYSLESLQASVREILKSREDWRSEP